MHFPSRIFNVYESGITIMQGKRQKVVSLRGKKQVAVLTSAEELTFSMSSRA
jgi:hypothetical protein